MNALHFLIKHNSLKQKIFNEKSTNESIEIDDDELKPQSTPDVNQPLLAKKTCDLNLSIEQRDILKIKVFIKI